MIKTLQDTNFRVVSMLVVASVVVACLLMVIVAENPAQAAFPGGNGDIVYSGWDEDDYDYEIYRMGANGGTLTNVTKNATDDREPAISRDGTKIAYSAWDGKDYEIFTIPATGGARTRVTNNTTDDRHPTWSPSGTEIAYQGYDGADYEIYKIGSSGGTPTPLTNNTDEDDLSPAWSPDGTTIAYCQDYPFGFGIVFHDIYTIPASGGTPTIKSREAPQADFNASPTWSPDGTQIAFVGYNSDTASTEIFTMSSGAGVSTKVTNTRADESSPAFSPNSSRIVYRGEDRPDNDFEIFSSPSAGGRPTKVTEVGWAASPDWQALPDTTAPTVTRMAAARKLSLANSLGHQSVEVVVDWGAADNSGGSNVAGYELQVSENGGAYANVFLPSPKTTSITPTFWDGTTYRYRVRARDASGNLSAWSVGPLSEVDLLQEDNTAITYPTGTWTTQSVFGASDGDLKYATVSPAKARVAFVGRDAALATTKGPDRGKAQVCPDPGTTGATCTTVDLYSATTNFRQLVPIKSFSTSASHTAEVRVPGTKNAASSGTRVDIDAFAVLR